MQRNVLVDKLKGYACFLVLFGHVIMGVRSADIPCPGFFRGLETFIWSFHVALFLFLSGVVYKETGEWKSKKTKLGFILHKLLNLGVPYIAFSTLYILINSFVGQANTQSSVRDILFIWKTPVAQYWFLYALFFLFCIYAAFSGILKNWIVTLLLLLIGYIAPLCGISLGSFDIVFYSAMAFGVGTFVPFNTLTKLPIWAKCIVIAAHVSAGVLFFTLGILESAIIKEFMLLLGIYASIQFISLLQDCKPISRFLDFINRYSFQIYLLHTIFTAGIRIVLQRLHITQWWIHVIVGTICGIAFPVLAAIIAGKIPALNFFFFPAKALKNRKNRKQI